VSKISKVHARQIFDSRGNPTIEAEVILNNNIKSSSIVPSGASTGTFEAYELRDNDKNYFLGKSVLKAVKNVNSIIAEKIKNQDPNDQKKIDDILLKLDGSENKKNLGANSLLAVSLAVRKAAMTLNNENYFDYKKSVSLPYPLMNIINGGVHANNNLRIQEFMIRPDRAKTFSDSMRICFLIIKNLSKLIKDKGLSTSVGDEGGFAPMISSNNQALDLIVSAIKKSGFVNGKDVSICLDVAANELYKKNKYSIHSKKICLC